MTGALSGEVGLGLVRSKLRRQRFTILSAVLFGVGAFLSWWMLIEEGRSAARLLTAVATTAAAVLQVTTVLRGKGRG